jgi:hypothetical protein
MYLLQGVFTLGCTDVSLLGLRITKQPGRPMSIAEDGAHLQNSRGGALLISGCTFEGQGDDGINTPTMYEVISYLSSDRLSFTVGEQGNPFSPGDPAHFFNRSSLLPLGTAIVASVDAANGSTWLVPPGAPAGVVANSLVINGAQYPESLTVTDNTFRSSWGHGTKLKGSNVLAARNVLEGCSMAALMTYTDGCHWLEGPAASNWSLINNSIHDCNFVRREAGDIIVDNYVQNSSRGGTECTYNSAAIPSAIQSGLVISGNSVVSNSSAAAIAVYSTSGILLERNTISYMDASRTPAADLDGFGVVGAVLANNTCDGHACISTGFSP